MIAKTKIRNLMETILFFVSFFACILLRTKRYGENGMGRRALIIYRPKIQVKVKDIFFNLYPIKIYKSGYKQHFFGDPNSFILTQTIGLINK